MRLFRLTTGDVPELSRQFDRVQAELDDLNTKVGVVQTGLNVVTSTSRIVQTGGGGTTDLDSAIKSRALSLLGPDFTYWSDTFVTVAGRAGSLWTNVDPPQVKTYPDEPGGIQGIEGFNRRIVVDPYYSAPFPSETPPKPSFIGPAASKVPFYMFARVRLLQDLPLWGYTPDGTVIVGLVDTGFQAVVGIGYNFSSGNFAAIGGELATVNGSHTASVPLNPVTPLDFLWHDYQMTRTADGKWWGRVDYGNWTDFTSVVLTGGTGFSGGMPFAAGCTTLATSPVLPYLLIDHYALAVGSPNRPAITTTIPTPG